MNIKNKLLKEAIKEIQQHNLKIGAEKVIQEAIDFGIEKETPKLKDDEMLSVKISKIPDVGFRVDVLRFKKKLTKCWQCKEYTVTTYKNEFGGYSESCSNKCGPKGLGRMLNFGR